MNPRSYSNVNRSIVSPTSTITIQVKYRNCVQIRYNHLLLMSHRESPVKSPVESPAEPPASAGVLTGEDVQRLLNMFLGSLTPKNEILVSIVRAPKGRVVV